MLRLLAPACLVAVLALALTPISAQAGPMLLISGNFGNDLGSPTGFAGGSFVLKMTLPDGTNLPYIGSSTVNATAFSLTFFTADGSVFNTIPGPFSTVPPATLTLVSGNTFIHAGDQGEGEVGVLFPAGFDGTGALLPYVAGSGVFNVSIGAFRGSYAPIISGSSTVVPEPTTLVAGLLGCLIASVAHRRRRLAA